VGEDANVLGDGCVRARASESGGRGDGRIQGEKARGKRASERADAHWGAGANKGIGLEVSRILGKVPGVVVCLGCRDEQRGQAAASMLKAEGCNVTFCRLDINDQTSIAAFANAVNATYGGLDILVNNAAIAFKGKDPTPFAQQARPTIRTNYYGTLAVCEALIPLMRNGGRVVNVASMSGPLRQFPRRAHDRILAPDFSRAELCALVDNFVETAENGLHGRSGWPNTCYGVSKAALNALTRILAREVAPRDILGEGRSVAFDVFEFES